MCARCSSPCPLARGSMRTRGCARRWTRWWGGSTDASRPPPGPRCGTWRAAFPPPRSPRFTAPPTSWWSPPSATG
jgi:hypothetical protein